MNEMKTNTSEVDVFRDAMIDDNAFVQVDAIKRLPSLAVAIDIERTRDELLPCISEYIDVMHEELLYNLAEQLENFVPFVGGVDHVTCILDILVKLSNVDETIVRDRAVKAMKNICRDLDTEHCNTSFFPLIERLSTNDWFTSKCSATALFAICYPKLSQDKQMVLRNLFRSLMQDDSPMVRRASETGLISLVEVLKPEEVISEFIPIFDCLISDEQDSVRVLAVDAGIALAKPLKDYEVQEWLLKDLQRLAADASWRVRQRIAFKIHEILIATGVKNREDIIAMFTSCVRDPEAEVRGVTAGNLYNFTISLKESFNNADQFEACFKENIMPQIHFILTDTTEVRLALSSTIMSLSGVLRNDCFKSNVLPLVLHALESEDSTMLFKENMLKNLNSLPIDVDITKSLKSINKVLQNLLEHSQLHWRTRRNVLLAFMHMAKNSTKEYFDKNLKIFYVHLLSDPVFAIRRTSPLILPLLIKQFGIDWAQNSLIPVFIIFSKDNRYLFRYVTLFGLNEMVAPTLDIKHERYLDDLKDKVGDKKYAEKLLAITVLLDKLNSILKDESFDSATNEDSDFGEDNIKIYAEDTLDNLKYLQSKRSVFAFEDSDATSYLEGLLVVLIKYFVEVLKALLKDPIVNVQERTRHALEKVKSFCKSLGREVEEQWVRDAVSRFTPDEVAKIQKEIEEELQRKKATLDDDDDFDLEERQGGVEQKHHNDGKEIVKEIGRDIGTGDVGKGLELVKEKTVGEEVDGKEVVIEKLVVKEVEDVEPGMEELKGRPIAHSVSISEDGEDQAKESDSKKDFTSG